MPADIKPDDSSPASLSADPTVAEAMKRFQRCSEWEANARERYVADIKFRHGDADNGFQWPNVIRRARDVDQRPCLTLNIIQQHNLQIINQMRQNKIGANVIPTGNGATKEASDAFREVIRSIEYKSDAQSAYTIGAEFQVDGGIGWWRLGTQYVSNSGPNAFDQEVVILPINDPLSVFMDPDIQQKDGSDAKFAFVYDTVPKDEFTEAYPKYANLATLQPLGVDSGDYDWVTRDHVRVCEYWRKVQKADKVISFLDGQGRRRTVKKSLLPDEGLEELLGDPMTRVRDVFDDVVEWKLIVGEEVIDETIWPGKYIPLVRVVGIETTIDGVLDRCGHTRAMKDGQRMYNYNASSQVEFVALQGKTPWKAPAKAIEEHESQWNTANNVNHSVLIYNHVDDEGNPIPPPERQDPPAHSIAYETGMQTAFNQLMMVSGQWQNQMGMQGNERTGAAISERQDQGDVATFHFPDNFALAVQFTAKQLLDLIPKVYDTQRVLRIQADDGTDYEMEIDPAARQAFQVKRNYEGQVVRRIFNPTVGEYDVQGASGPSYGTKRTETVKAMTLLLTQNPDLTGIIGDLLLSAMDFDKAQEAAQRMKRMVPKQALGEGPSQTEQQLQQQLTVLQGALAKSLEKQAKDQVKLVGKDQMRDIDAYKAETDRFKALADSIGLDQEGLQAVLRQLVGDSLATNITAIGRDNQSGIAEQSGNPDALAAPPGGGNALSPPSGDAEWYLTDPTRRGRVMRLAPLAQEHNPRGVVGNA